MGFFGWVILLFVIAIICRALRAAFEAIDGIVYLIVLAVTIIVWISEGFWMGLLAGFIGCIAASLLFGMGGGTKVSRFGHNYTLTCPKCGYDDLEIIEHTNDGVIARCKRCGHTGHCTLNH